MTLIGLGYRAKSGKDTVGKYLVDTYGFHRVSVGDIIRDICTALTGLDAHDPAFKYSTAIMGLTGGQLMQNIGVSIRTIHPDILIEASRLATICTIYPRVVVTDVRFSNEAAHIRKLGGKLVEVYRNGLAHDTHPSESEGSSILWHYTLNNTAEIKDLTRNIEYMLTDLCFDREC